MYSAADVQEELERQEAVLKGARKGISTEEMEEQRKTAPRKMEDNDLVDRLRMRISELEGELDLVHSEYEKKLQDQNNKANEKNEFFLNLIQQMQQRHNEEVAYYRTMVENFEEEKKQMGSIENKMNQIGAGIEDILRESSQLSRTNEQLERRLQEKDRTIESLKKDVARSTQNLESYQQRMDEYEKLRLKTAKKNKDMLEMLDEADKEVSNFISNSRHTANEICKMTGNRRKDCNHCCLSSLSNKYSDMIDQQQI